MTIHSPHDKLFKQSMSDIRVARDFFMHHLPQTVLDVVNLQTLKLSPNSYVDENLAAYSSDVLYEVEQKDGKRVYLY